MLITVRNSSCGKVMFSQACVKNSVHRGRVHGKGECAWQGDMHSRGHAWWGACVAGGVHDGGVCAWQERRPLQQMVRILLECILVVIGIMFMTRCEELIVIFF